MPDLNDGRLTTDGEPVLRLMGGSWKKRSRYIKVRTHTTDTHSVSWTWEYEEIYTVIYSALERLPAGLEWMCKLHFNDLMSELPGLLQPRNMYWLQHFWLTSATNLDVDLESHSLACRKDYRSWWCVESTADILTVKQTPVAKLVCKQSQMTGLSVTNTSLALACMSAAFGSWQ